MTETESKKDSPFSVATSIVIAGVIIAGAILITNGSGGGGNNNVANNNVPTTSLENFRKIQRDDHVKGNPNAKVTIVEFSDFECPFCASIHPSLTKIIEEREDVNWVYRHFPLNSIHPRASGAAIASECIAELGGNDAFWQFTDNIFSDKQVQLGSEFYLAQARGFGIDETRFQNCLDSDNTAQKVTDDLNEATASGGRGTPFSVIIAANGDYIPFSGAIPYENILALVDEALDR